MSEPVDVLLVSVTAPETRAILAAILEVNGDIAPLPKQVGGRMYRDFGMVNDARVFHTQCEMGTSGVDASQQAITYAIRDLKPGQIIMVGIAFGVDEEKQNIGDVLVSKRLTLYELQKIDKEDKVVLRGSKPDCSSHLLGLFRYLESDSDFKIPLRIGPILSGEKLIDNLDYRESLKALESEAIGGEMEGTGLYTACQSAKVDWILVKGICDWADGNKSEDKEARQALAAKNAAQAVAKALTLVSFQRPEVAHRPFETNLPQGRGRFFGREELKEKIFEWARAGETGALCLYGPGGVGKTRLSEEAGHALKESFDLIWKISFESLKPETATGQQVAGQIALSLGAEQVDEAAKQLVAFVKAKGERALLILDNFESADNADTQKWLAEFAQSGIRCLVTSRKRLTLRNLGQNFEVNRLELPDSASEDFDNLPSVQLFRDRLDNEVKLAPFAELSEEDRAGLVAVLRATDGFPLAIEIVAANRVHASGSLQEIADTLGIKRMAYRADLDETGGGPDRHESMGACFQWSLDLLDKEEADRFVTLGVFPYDFSPEAAQEVCGVSELDLNRWWQRSLIVKSITNNRMLIINIFKEYILIKYKISNIIMTNISEYFKKIMEICMKNGDLDINNIKIIEILDLEWRNMYSVRQMCLCIPDIDGFLKLSSISHYLGLKGYWEYQKYIWIDQLDIVRRMMNDLGRDDFLAKSEANALGNLGNICMYKGDWDNALKYFTEELAICENINDQSEKLRPLISLSASYLKKNDYENAIKLSKSALIISNNCGKMIDKSNVLKMLGDIYLCQKKFDESSQYFSKSMKIKLEINDFHGMAEINVNIAEILRQKKQYIDAIKLCKEAVLMFKNTGDVFGEAQCLISMGNIYYEDGDLGKAEEYYNQGLKQCVELGAKEGEFIAVSGLSLLYNSQKKDILAIEYTQKSIDLCDILLCVSEKPGKLRQMGNLYRRNRELEQAISFFRQAEDLTDKIKDFDEYAKSIFGICLCLLAQKKINEALNVCKNARIKAFLSQDVQFISNINKSMQLINDVNNMNIDDRKKIFEMFDSA